MTRQISMEAALNAYRKKCGELLEANILLEAQAAELQAENEQLKGEAASLPAEERTTST
ncbi:hypothetical protein ACIQ1S_09360 [Streptomyces griseus]|uniref:hypothetical protein n=1 Tax=Streptomyces griseus TaxID=1911 RepID=UPI0036744BB0